MTLRLLFVAMTFLFANPLWAQNPFADITLSPERVEAAIAAYMPMRDRIEAMSGEFEASGDAGDVAQQLQALAMLGAGGMLDGTAQEYGFDGYADWLGTTYAVFMAHGFAQHPELDADVQEALARIDSETSLSDAQKEQMKQMLQHSLGAIAAMRPSEANLAAVAPYQAEIQALLEE
jgi:hypothetical protein